MSVRSVLCSRSVVVVLVFLATFAEAAHADGVQPVHVSFRELPSGDVEVHWNVPKQIPANALPNPRLPDGSRPVGAHTLVERPGS